MVGRSRSVSAWLVYPMRWRSARMSVRPSTSPSTTARPDQGRSYDDSRRNRVVLPEPFGPTITQRQPRRIRSGEHPFELQSLMRISYAVFCLKKKTHVAQFEGHL